MFDVSVSKSVLSFASVVVLRLLHGKSPRVLRLLHGKSRRKKLLALHSALRLTKGRSIVRAVLCMDISVDEAVKF